MTRDDSNKPPRPDPFAPLPLSASLTGKTGAAPEPEPESEPAPPPASPLPPTAFTSRVSGEHDAPVVPAAFDASAYEPPPEPAYIEPPEPAYVEPPVELPPPAPTPFGSAKVVEPPAPVIDTLAVENELRDAVGATPIVDSREAKKTPKKRRATTDDGDDDRPRSKLWMLAAALAVVLGGGITAMVLVGRANSDRLVLACEAERVVILQGRSFPPWGETTLEGAEWKPVKIPAEAPCVPFETESKAELAARFEKLLEERATRLVGGRGGTSTAIAAAGPEDPVTKVDEAEASLKQALLVARHLPGDDAINKREALERLLGDVTYWRASARLRAAATALDDAAKQFDMAVLQQPRANSDPQEWATLARKLAEELRAGPQKAGGEVVAPVGPAPTGTSRPVAPPGVALPVEPPTAGSAVEPVPADAGVPASGGVLL